MAAEGEEIDMSIRDESQLTRLGKDSPPDKKMANDPAPAKDGPPPAPDGGKQAWLQVLSSWCLIFSTFGTIVMFGDFQAYYERGTLFEESSSNISWIGSVQSLMFFFVGALAGPVFDRGHLKFLIAVGGFLLVFGYMMLSLCTEFWEVLLAQGFVIGIGGGCLFVPALSVIQPYFSSRLGLALGVVGTGSSMGSIIYPIIFINLVDRIGFAWTTRVLGFISLASFLLPLFVAKQYRKPAAVRSLWDASAFSDGKFLLCILGCFLGYAGTQATFFYLAYFGESNGWFSGNVALYLVPIISSTAIIGRVLPNIVADKAGAVNVVIPGSILMGIISLCNIAVVNAAGVICTALFFGFVSGTFISIPPLLFMTLTADKSKLGARVGIGYAFTGLSVLLAGPPTGAILQHRAGLLDWRASWVYAGVLPLAACLAFGVLRLWQAGLKLRVKV